MSTHVLHMTRLHAKRPLLVELRVINGPFEGGCRLQSGGGAWLACIVQHINALLYTIGLVLIFERLFRKLTIPCRQVLSTSGTTSTTPYPLGQPVRRPTEHRPATDERAYLAVARRGRRPRGAAAPPAAGTSPLPAGRLKKLKRSTSASPRSPTPGAVRHPRRRAGASAQRHAACALEELGLNRTRASDAAIEAVDDALARSSATQQSNSAATVRTVTVM